MAIKTTRDHIVEASDQLFYMQGFDHTSFTHIADSVKISRGNFYYHFKTKDEILDAVIEFRLKKTKNMLKQWENDNVDPEQRILDFIHILIRNRELIIRYGCPVGTLNAELIKLDHNSKQDAKKIFSLFRTWLKKQFTLLGHAKQADALAMYILSQSQGVATLASVFDDEKFIKQEVKRMTEWLQSL